VVPVQRRHVAIGECYQEQLKHHPKLAGRVDVQSMVGEAAESRTSVDPLVFLSSVFPIVF
jgi:hypothetical protein